MAKKLLYEGSEWSFAALKRVYDAINTIATDELKLSCYPSQIEIISSEQMLDNYTSIGLPIMYNHWSFGKHFLREEFQYRKGYSGLAYEIVSNTSPCIAYLMEENSMTMQTLVLAHACSGHNTFFKNNYLFRQWTDASSIIDYLVFAKKYIAECEERHGHKAVEEILDSCHALRDHGVSRYRRPSKPNKETEEREQKARAAYVQQHANDLWRTLPPTSASMIIAPVETFPKEPEENILYFLEKNSPVLESWQREIIRIVRKIATYFYPQRQTQVCNEGTACTVHYYIMNRLWEKGLISDGSYLEFIHSHTSVVFQPSFEDPRYRGLNPYFIGFNIFKDIRRICEQPTAEDYEWFPDIAGTPWLPVFHHVIENYRDESFIRQYLSPHLMREWRMFLVADESSESEMTIANIHNQRGYKKMRDTLARSYELREPDIQIVDTNLRGSRTLKLRHTQYNGVQLENDEMMLRHVSRLWGYDVELESVGQDASTTFLFKV